jgi:hypothetical protein
MSAEEFERRLAAGESVTLSGQRPRSEVRDVAEQPGPIQD